MAQQQVNIAQAQGDAAGCRNCVLGYMTPRMCLQPGRGQGSHRRVVRRPTRTELAFSRPTLGALKTSSHAHQHSPCPTAQPLRWRRDSPQPLESVGCPGQRAHRAALAGMAALQLTRLLQLAAAGGLPEPAIPVLDLACCMLLPLHNDGLVVRNLPDCASRLGSC